MKLLSRALALTLVLALPSSASEVGGYPNASTLTGTERLLADQGSPGVTVNITPAQIQSYIFTSGVLPINLGGTGAGIASLALTNLLPSQTGLAGECLSTTGTFAQWINCAGAVGANPTATVGLIANNGSSTNFMRADASPPLNQAISPTWTGNHTFASTSGNAIVVNPASSASSIVMNWASGSGGIVNEATVHPTIIMNSSGANFGQIFDAGAGHWALGYGTSPLTNGSQVLQWSSAGNVIIPAPSSGIAFTSTGPNSNFAGQFQGSAGTGVSFGLLVAAGTNATDQAFNVVNAADTSQFMLIYGNGGIIVGAPAGSNQGPGTINMQGCFINGVACSTASGGPAAAGTLTGTTLASNVVSSSLTSLGTIGTLNVSGAANVTNSIVVGGLTNEGAGTINTPSLFQSNQPVYAGIPQNAQSGAYTLVLSDANKHIYKSAGSSAVTVPANSSVAFPIGTAVTVVNDGTGAMSININTDTLVLSPGGSTGTRTLAVFGEATMLKVGTTRWYISGSGLTRLIEAPKLHRFESYDLAMAA